MIAQKEKSAPDVDALQRLVHFWKAWHFKDQTKEDDHFHLSISKHCFNADDHKSSRNKNSFGAFSTSTDFLFCLTVKKTSPFILFVFFYDYSQTDHNISPLLFNQAFIQYISWLTSYYAQFWFHHTIQNKIRLLLLYPTCPTKIFF